MIQPVQVAAQETLIKEALSYGRKFVRYGKPANYIPELAKKDYSEVAPGESTSYYNGFQFDPEGGIITVTFMDNFHQIKDKLVVELDPATLTTYQAP